MKGCHAATQPDTYDFYQLAALKDKIVKRGEAPYADFSIFTPFQSNRDPWTIVIPGMDRLLAGLQSRAVHDPASKLRRTTREDGRQCGRHGGVLRPHRKLSTRSFQRHGI